MSSRLLDLSGLFAMYPLTFLPSTSDLSSPDLQPLRVLTFLPPFVSLNFQVLIFLTCLFPTLICPDLQSVYGLSIDLQVF
jgi:hypothetical protein